jgi:hypothetical protein
VPDVRCPAEGGGVMPFPAMYPGVCGRCDGPIRPGQQITSDGDDGYVHLACLQVTDEPAAAPCPSCRLVHRGECF